jgi:hypothetical protein
MARNRGRRKQPEKGAATFQACRKIVTGMLIKSANRSKTCDKQLEPNVGGAPPDQDQRNKIGTDNRKKKIARCHIAGRDAFRSSRRMMQIVAKPAKPPIMQHPAMGSILDRVMSHGHQYKT